MIKNIKYTIVFLFLLSSVGCNRFLEVTPTGRTTIPVLFSDMDGARAGMSGIYSKMYVYYASHFYLYPEIAGNMLSLSTSIVPGSQLNIYNFNNDPTDEAQAVGKIWSDINEALANINNLLFYIPELEAKFPGNVDELRSYKAQALFLRALCHFDLSRVYAQPYNYTADASHLGVPVLDRTPGPDDNVSRKSVKEVYDFILKDLSEAEKLFEGLTSKGAYYVSLEAVEALLSRVYLYKGDAANTIKYASKVIDKKPLAPRSQYVAMFKTLSGAEPETLLRFNGMDKSSALIGFYNPVGVIAPSGIPADTLLKLFVNKEDIRFSQLLRENATGSGSNTIHVTEKFNAEQTDLETNRQHYNPFVLRVSEMYLNRSEAYFMNKEYASAANDLKPLIARALNLEVSEITIDITSPSALDQMIEEERIRELYFEGHRLFDITRRKKDLQRSSSSSSTVKFLGYPNDRFVLPIPQMELDANTNMVGNPTVNN